MLLVGIFGPIILMNLIKSEAANSAVMTSDTYALWGQIPGETNAYLKRDFTFYDFKNPLDVLFRNHTPIFVEQGPFTYQEIQNFTDPQFSEDGNVVEFKQWIRTIGHHDYSVTFANFVAFGAWHQLKNTEPAMFCLQAFSSFYFEMKKFLYWTMISSTIRPTFITEKSARETFLKDLPLNIQDDVWMDNEFGMNNVTAFINWVVATEDGPKADSAMFLRHYFTLTYAQMSNILKALSGNVKAAKALLKEVYCTQSPTGECYAEYLSARQWATQEITMNTPAGVDPTPSVMTGNLTGHGYPELSYYYNEYFIKLVDTSEEYKGLKFTTEWALKVLDHYPKYTVDDPQYYTDPHLIMHIGNLRYAYSNGQQYDKTKDNEYLSLIQSRFLLESIKHARVFWEYLKYMEQEFAAQISLKGDMAMAALGTVVSQTLYAEMMEVQRLLLPQLLMDIMNTHFKGCHEIVGVLDDITETQSNKFCSRQEYWQWNKQSIGHIIQLCDEQGGEYWGQIMRDVGFKEYQLMQLCDQDEIGFGYQLGQAHLLLKQLYGCSKQQCTNVELSVKQWATSLVSLNPPLGLYQPSHSIHFVYPTLFPNIVEYSWFIHEFADVVEQQQFSYQEARYLLSFDCLYNGVMLQNAFIYYSNDNKVEFSKWFLFTNYNSLHYFRYLMLEIALDGFADTRTLTEVLFGYWPTIVTAIKTMNPAMGGDPSAPPAGLNFNFTEEQQVPMAMYTGKNDLKMLRKFQNVDGLDHLEVRIPYFDGNISTTRQYNPWPIEEHCNLGTDAMSYAPGQEKNGEIDTIITDLFRNANMKYQETVDFHGLEGYVYVVDPSFYAINPNYNNLKWNGVINFTTAMNAPIFNSPPHFYSGDEQLSQFIKIYKHENLTDQQFANKWDDSVVIVEPLTGVALSALLNLQINVEYKQDILFPCDNYALLPVMSLWRGANWTEEQINITFADLKTGFIIKKIILIVGLCLGIVILIVSILLYYFKIHKARKVEQLLGEPNVQIQQQVNNNNEL